MHVNVKGFSAASQVPVLFIFQYQYSTKYLYKKQNWKLSYNCITSL